MYPSERDTVLDAVYRYLEAAAFSKIIGGHHQCLLDRATSYLDYLLDRVHAKYDLWVIRDELGLPKPKGLGRFSR